MNVLQAQELKEYILDNEYVEQILDDLGCKHIRHRGEYISASNPDGNNTQAVIVYLNENLTCLNYTRQIAKNKRTTDIFDLVSFYQDFSFPEALKYVHSLLGLDYYAEREELCESLQILRMLKDMQLNDGDVDDTPVKPIPEKILSYYLPYGNIMFADDNISLEVQQEFEIGYDSMSNYITIPVRDSLGSLCGVKGRYFGQPDERHTKYTYLEKCNKAKILYGYWQNRECIKNSKFLYIVESEKAVQQLATIGVRNVVATAGKTISQFQIELITRTGCIPILALDKDVEEDELKEIAAMFMEGIVVYAIIDKDNVLDEKESPSDNPEKWAYLVKNHIYKIRDGNNNE